MVALRNHDPLWWRAVGKYGWLERVQGKQGQGARGVVLAGAMWGRIGRMDGG